MLSKLIKDIYFSPKEGWIGLTGNSNQSKRDSYVFLLVIVILASTLSFVGTLIKGDGVLLVAFQYSGFVLFKWLLSISAASWAISKLAKGFKGCISSQDTLILLTVSSSFLIVLSSLGHIFTGLRIFFYVASSIGLIYYYFGLLKLTGINGERITGFLLISLLVFAIIVFIVELMLVIIFNIPIHL
jgi:hypothetical protein